MPYYDEEGNEVEGILPPDEAKALQEKYENMETEITEKQAELEKLRNKDMNFGNLRKKSKEEIENMTKNWKENEKTLLNEIQSLNRRLDERDYASVGKLRENKLDELSGDDKKLRENIQREFERLGGNDALTPEDVNRIYDEAIILIEHRQSNTDPINRFVPSANIPSVGGKKKKFTQTSEGEAAFKQWFGL